MVPPPPIVLIPVTPELHEIYETLAASAARGIHAACPLEGLDIQHVGATAVPGLLTKGDLDLVVRVAPEAFEEVVHALESVFPRGYEENWQEGQSASFALPPLRELEGVEGTVQVVSSGGPYDIFISVRDLMRRYGGIRVGGQR